MHTAKANILYRCVAENSLSVWIRWLNSQHTFHQILLKRTNQTMFSVALITQNKTRANANIRLTKLHYYITFLTGLANVCRCCSVRVSFFSLCLLHDERIFVMKANCLSQSRNKSNSAVERKTEKLTRTP